MHGGKTSLIIFLSIIVFVALAFLYSKSQDKELINTNQDPQYLIEARKNIIGVWYQENATDNVWEFKIDGKLICKNGDNQRRTLSFKIANISPICGYEVEVDEGKETMYLITTEEDGTKECGDLSFPVGYQNKKNCLGSLGYTSIDSRTIFNKK